jgi:hypothetical protein
MTQHTWLATQSQILATNTFYSCLETLFADLPRNTPIIYTCEQMQSMGFKTPARVLQGLAEMSGTIDTCFRVFCRERNIPLLLRKYHPLSWIKWLFPDREQRTKNPAAKKEDSINTARRLFPLLQDQLARKKDHNRSEALLLAFTTLAELSGCNIEIKLKNTDKTAEKYRANTVPIIFTDIIKRCRTITNLELTNEILLLKNRDHK